MKVQWSRRMLEKQKAVIKLGYNVYTRDYFDALSWNKQMEYKSFLVTCAIFLRISMRSMLHTG